MAWANYKNMSVEEKRENWKQFRRRYEDKKRRETQTLQAIRAHDCKAHGCGVVCTAFDW